jgi:transcriptional regulator with XRE-family HTH domain
VATSIGYRIRRAREEAGFTAEQLAPLIGVTMGTLLRWERDENAISVKNVMRVAELTGKPLTYFLSEEAA